jgi:hypothetical protein
VTYLIEYRGFQTLFKRGYSQGEGFFKDFKLRSSRVFFVLLPGSYPYLEPRYGPRMGIKARDFKQK